MNSKATHTQDIRRISQRHIIRDRLAAWQGSLASSIGLPMMTAIILFGLVIVNVSFEGTRHGHDWGYWLYAIALTILFLPAAFRLCAATTPRNERIGILVVLGIALYMVKVSYSPLQFKFADEFQHWLTAQHIIETRHLFFDNFILPVSPFYPALQNITTTLSRFTGLSTFHAGLLTIGIGRLMLVLALYLMYERLSESARIASIATLIYMCNPHFLFLNAMFTYQALGLAVMMGFLFAAVDNAHHDRAHYAAPLIILLCAVLVSHHITSYMIVLFLIAWVVISLVLRRFGYVGYEPILLTGAGLAFTIFYVTNVASLTIGYLRPFFEEMYYSIIGLFSPTTQVAVETGFRPPAQPLIERLMNMGAVGLIVAALPVGVFFLYRYYRHKPITLTFGTMALGYYGVIAIRFLASNGAEMAGRSFPFIFVPVGLVLAIGAVRGYQWLQTTEDAAFWQHPVIERTRLALTVPYLMWLLPLIIFAVFVGGIMGGWPPTWGRVPGDYIPSAFERSITAESMATASWMHTTLGENNRIATDSANYSVLGAHGEQEVVRGITDAYFTSRLSEDAVIEYRDMEVAYVLADDRITQAPSPRGFYVRSEEPDWNGQAAPQYAFDKYEGMPYTPRIYDSGNIVIYDIQPWIGAYAVGAWVPPVEPDYDNIPEGY